MPRQPRAVWAVSFSCVIAFMGIGLVDPILKPIADQLGATPSDASLLFTSYVAVMGVAMLFTGAVSSRLGAKRTLLVGLLLIVLGAGLAGTQDSIGGIVALRAVWGLGNALFIATALTTIVRYANGSEGRAIILFESALGIGIASGPLLGGWLGSISWRAPFFGVSVLMVIALAVTAVALPATPTESRTSTLLDPFRALRKHRGLLIVALTALLYSFGFFTLLAFTPFPLDLNARQIGFVFFGWGTLLAFTSVIVAPRLQRRFGTLPTISVALSVFALTLAVMAANADSKPVLIACVIFGGAVLGVNNTLITETVMKAAPVDQGVASAAYNFLRFGGGAVAPWVAGKLGESIGVAVPYWVAATMVALGVLLFVTGRRTLAHIDATPRHSAPVPHSREEAEAITVGDA